MDLGAEQLSELGTAPLCLPKAKEKAMAATGAPGPPALRCFPREQADTPHLLPAPRMCAALGASAPLICRMMEQHPLHRVDWIRGAGA